MQARLAILPRSYGGGAERSEAEGPPSVTRDGVARATSPALRGRIKSH
jgi:hypothetical protein